MKCCFRTTLFLICTFLALFLMKFFWAPHRTTPEIDAVTYQTPPKKQPEKKILILSSRGGGGHTSVSNALAEYLKQDYTLSNACVFGDVLAPLDLTRTITGDVHCSEDLYNYSLQHKWYWIAPLMAVFGTWYFNLRRESVIALLTKFFKKIKPDLIISVIPYINNIILETTERLNIPFLLIPTDLDTTTFLQYIHHPEYKDFRVVLPFDEGILTRVSKSSHIPNDNVHITGFPVRKQFLMSAKQRFVARKQTRRQLDIPMKKPTALLLMGAVGSQEIPVFIKWLSRVKTPLHIIAAIGKSEHLRTKLLKMVLPNHISLSIIGFTNNMANLMAASDLIITKSGTVSVCEALYMELPMILDGSTRVLPWEKLNHRFVETFGLGVSLKSLYDLPRLITEFLGDHKKEKLLAFQKNLALFEKKHPISNIQAIIKQMIY